MVLGALGHADKETYQGHHHLRVWTASWCRATLQLWTACLTQRCTQAAVPLTPLLAGLLLHTTELMHMEREGFWEEVTMVVCSADEQR